MFSVGYKKNVKLSSPLLATASWKVLACTHIVISKSSSQSGVDTAVMKKFRRWQAPAYLTAFLMTAVMFQILISPKCRESHPDKRIQNSRRHSQQKRKFWFLPDTKLCSESSFSVILLNLTFFQARAHSAVYFQVFLGDGLQNVHQIQCHQTWKKNP